MRANNNSMPRGHRLEFGLFGQSSCSFFFPPSHCKLYFFIYEMVKKTCTRRKVLGSNLDLIILMLYQLNNFI